MTDDDSCDEEEEEGREASEGEDLVLGECEDMQRQRESGLAESEETMAAIEDFLKIVSQMINF